MAKTAAQLLQDRIAELDTRRLPIVAFDADPRLVHVASVMQFYTNTAIAAACGGPAVVTPAAADEIVDTCRLLHELRETDPELVTGPLPQERQHWIGMNRHGEASEAVPEPSRSRFAEPAGAAGSQPSVKPWDAGFYTSTATRRGRSMWRTYLDFFYYGSDLFPLPWYTWEVQAQGCVLDITSAVEWAAFVDAYPQIHDSKVYPDWSAAARDVDGVHMTLPGIVATQGISFPIARGLTAPAYWDVETTLWLRWVFTLVQLREITR
jgi:hypothetical protein